MKITEQELNHLLAGVMGWEYVVVDYRTHDDPPDIVEFHRMMNNKSDYVKIHDHSVGEYYISDKDKDMCLSVSDWKPTSDERHAMQVAEEWLKNNCKVSWYTFLSNIGLLMDARFEPPFCHAICLAVAEAETGIKYELEG